MRPHSFPRVRTCAVNIRGKFYLIGGQSLQRASTAIEEYIPEVYKSVEIYDPNKDYWYNTKQLNKARTSFGCTVKDNLIICIGGTDKTLQPTASVEICDIREVIII